MTAQAAETVPAPSPGRSYPVYLREGRRFGLKFADQGVTLANEHIAWTHDGQARSRRFDEIDTIRLQVMHVHKSGDVGTCEIRFRDRIHLMLFGGTAWGYADETQAKAYAACIRHLHERLAASGVTTIRYRAGLTENRHIGAVAVVVIGALFFVGLPLVLWLVIRKWEVFGVLAAGATFIWPFVRKLQDNVPRDYTPQQVPPELLP